MAYSTLQIGPPGNKAQIPRIGLGAMGMSMAYGKTNDQESLEVLHRAIDIGCTHWDTADVYGFGHNEQLLSRVLKERRQDIFLSTKFGCVVDKPRPGSDDSFMSLYRGEDGSPEYVHKACEASLKRLGTSYIDLFYQHRMDPKVPIEDTVRAMAQLVEQGKVRYLGLSECSPEDIRRAHKVHPITAVQVKYSLWSTDIETDGVLDTCRQLGITIVTYSPLGSGFLTGRIRSIDGLDSDDWRRKNSRFQSEHLAQNLKLVDALEVLARNLQCTSGQLALAWLLEQEENMVLIPGTKHTMYLEENFAASKVKLTPDGLTQLRKLVDSANI